MKIDHLVERWLREGLIGPEQAERMRADVAEALREKRSNRFVLAVSTIGAILLGTGALLFIASNWQALGAAAKVGLLVGATGAAYVAGYVLRYARADLPGVGGALLFLSALLLGAAIMLTAQIYHVNANAHVLVLLWLAGILPLVYAMRTVPVALLAALLYFVWLWQYVSSPVFFGAFMLAPPLFGLAALALFGAGGLHYLRPGLEPVARTWRLTAMQVAMAALFLETFAVFSDAGSRAWARAGGTVAPLWPFAAAAFAALGLDMALRRASPPAVREGLLGLAVAALLAAVAWLPLQGPGYPLVFNLGFVALTLGLVWLGTHRGDIRVVNLGVFWLAAFLVARYFDWFWGLMDRALFFLVGGVILVAGGVVLERQRRRIKAGMGR